MNMPPKKLYIKTWGCQMNVYDSHRIGDMLRPLGYVPTDTPDDADMMILNTCHIRDKATDKVFSELGRLRDHKTARKNAGHDTIIGVAGCVAQAEGDVITKRAPYIDMVFGPQTYGQLPEMVVAATGGARPINTEFPVVPKFDQMVDQTAAQGPSAFLSVQEGCDKFCTFCVVPYTRGAEFSRPVRDVLAEAARIIDTGAVEITLLGQNVNAYHGDGPDGTVWGLGRLIEELAKLDALKRIRYTTSHPRDCDAALMAAHRDIHKLMPFLHLPVQSGSDTMLKAMNRKHTVDDYRRTIDAFRDARPDMGFSSDFIVGFPGETDTDHAASLALVRDIGYASAYSFKYSARPGTPAAAMQAALVPEAIKTARLHELQAVINQAGLVFNQTTVGKTVSVLFDRHDAVRGQLHGRTEYNQPTHIDGPAYLLGQIAPVQITGCTSTAVRGECFS
jgi:tRNA-2-methylthio-N6-dimethylallyladenosine synthase